MKHLLLLLILFYKKCIDPFKPKTCRFYPTCSDYMAEAIRQYGAWRGFYLGIKRLLKCHPFHPGGVDFVDKDSDNQP